MVVALTLTPALCLILLRKAPDRAARVAGGALAAAGLHARCCARVVRRPRWIYAGVGPRHARRRRGRPDAGPVAVPGLQGARLPDALGDPARARPTPRWSARPRRSARSCGDPGRAQLRRAHRPGVPRRGGRRGQLRGELDEHRPDGRLRRDLRGDRGGHRRVPGPVPRDADLPRRAHRGGAHRRQGADRRPRLRGGPDRPAGEGRGDRPHPGRHRRRRRPPRRHLHRRAADRGGGRPGQARRSTASSPATSAGPRRPWSPARRSATSSAAAGPTTSSCGASRAPGTASTPCENLPIDTPSGAAGAARGRRRRRRSGPPRTRSSARTAPGDSTSARTSRAATSARWSPSWTRSWPQVDFPPRLPRRGPRRVPGAAGGPEPAADHRGHRRSALILLLLQASFGSWRPALLVFLTLPMALVGGVLAAWATGGILSSARWSASSPSSGSPPATGSC